LSDDRGFTLRARDAAAIAAGIRQLKNTPRDLTGPRAVPRLRTSDADIYIPIVNETGSVLPAGSVVRVGRQVVKLGRGGSEYPFKNYAWVATLPDDELTGSYAVLQSTVQKGLTGRALLVGVTKVKLDDSDEGDYAKPIPNDFTKMKTGGDGYPVLGVEESGSSDTWGFVLLMKGDADIKVAIFDGTRNGKVYTGHLLNPATGAAGTTAVQWMFWGDAGVETLIDANKLVVLTHKCPAYLENDEDWSPSGGPKYMAVSSSQPSKTLFAKFTGSRNGKRYTGRLVNDDGSLGANIQWIFDGGNDPGTADVIDAGAYVKVRKAPAWLASNPHYGDVATYGEKYEADSPIWAVLA